MAKLKPCPFCGGKASRGVALKCDRLKYDFECQAHCEKCGAEIRVRYNFPCWVKNPEKEAKRYIARLWNTRTPTADVVEVVRCKDCKYYKVGNPNADYCYHERYEGLSQSASYKPDDFCSYGTPKERGGEK